MRSLLFYVSAIAFLASMLICSCTKQDSVQNPILVDQIRTLKDGEAVSYKLSVGTYKLDVTSGPDGATIEVVGSTLPKSGPVKTSSCMFDMPVDGQVIVTNPTGFGTGPSISVTVKITRITVRPAAS